MVRRDEQARTPHFGTAIPDEVKSQGNEAIRRFQDSHRLAYQDDALVNWCPALGTVLANEEVIDGRSERGDHPVQRIPLRRGCCELLRMPIDCSKISMVSIGHQELRNYKVIGSGAAQEPKSTSIWAPWILSKPGKIQRKNHGWPIKPKDDVLRVYTTRPDTLFGATYMVIAPEHPLAKSLTSDSQRAAVETYTLAASFKSDRERSEDGDKAKTGVFTGSFAINPVNGKQIQFGLLTMFLPGYGTGAIMAVPAHDERDFEFALTYSLPVIQVVAPPDIITIDRQALAAGKLCLAVLEQRFTPKTSMALRRSTPKSRRQLGYPNVASVVKL